MVTNTGVAHVLRSYGQPVLVIEIDTSEEQMNRAIAGRELSARKAPQLPLSRLGDVGLSSIWVVLAFISIRNTIAEADVESTMATAHHAVSALILCISAVLFIYRKPAISRSASLGSNVIAIVGSWLMPVLIVLPLTSSNDVMLSLTTAGLVVTHVAVFWSLLTLRRSFSIFPEARALVRTGPYAIVRHPLYAVYFVMYACFLLPRLSVWAVAITTIGIFCEVVRSREEESVLRTAFPEYDEYAASTPRFCPRLRRR